MQVVVKEFKFEIMNGLYVMYDVVYGNSIVQMSIFRILNYKILVDDK